MAPVFALSLSLFILFEFYRISVGRGQGVHFDSFEESKARGVVYEMSSFSENKVAKILGKGQVSAFADYNTRQLARIYPKARAQLLFLHTRGGRRDVLVCILFCDIVVGAREVRWRMR